jgi:hypothetical protein
MVHSAAKTALTAATNAHTYTDTAMTAASARADAGDAATLQTSRTYTDTRATATLASANSYTDQRIQALTLELGGLRTELNDRFEHQDRRISRNGAMSAAMMQMAGNSAYAKPARGRLAVGIGVQNGESALSVGYGRRFGDDLSMSIGAAFSSDDTSGGIGFGVDL